MQKTKLPKPSSSMLIAIAIFLFSYALSLVIWIAVKNYYGYAVTYWASHIASAVKGTVVESITKGGDMLKVTFIKYTYVGKVLVDVPVKISAFTFNVPLTCAVMASLYPYIRRKKKAYSEAILALILIHSLFVCSLEANVLTQLLMGKGIEPMSKTKLIFYEFTWSFTDNMVIRFEPFLIGFYLFLRFRKER